MDVHIPQALLVAAQTTLLLLAVALVACLLHARYKKVTVLSVAVRFAYFVARWFQNFAVQSDKFLLEWRRYRNDNPIAPANESSDRPQPVQLKKRVASK